MVQCSLQTGFPLVTVTRDYSGASATVSQARFFLDGAKQGDNSRYCAVVAQPALTTDQLQTVSWWIPLTMAEPGLENFDNTYNKEWLRAGQQSRRLTGLPAPDQPVVFNVQQTGIVPQLLLSLLCS